MTETSIPLVAGTFITIALLLGGSYLITDADKDKAYVCESSGMVALCDKLSSGIGTRCYYQLDGVQKYKICSEGWKKYDQPITPIPDTTSQQWLCSPEGCIPK